MIEALDVGVSIGVVGAGSDLVNAEALVEGVGTFRAKLKSIVGKQGNGASPKRDVEVDEDVVGA